MIKIIFTIEMKIITLIYEAINHVVLGMNHINIKQFIKITKHRVPQFH